MSTIHRHMDVEELEKYSMGTASPDMAELIEEHLLACEKCQGLLEEADDFQLGMQMASQRVRLDERSRAARQWKFPAWFPAMAAAFGLSLVAIVTFSFLRSPGMAIAVSLTALRNNGAGIIAPAGRDLVLHPDLTGLTESSSYRLEIVDLAGRSVRQGTLSRVRGEIKIPALNAGLYFVRVYLPAGSLLREYGLEIR